VKVIGSSAKTSFFYKKDSKDLPNWHLIYKYKCSSTENQLTNYLKEHDLKNQLPIAIFSKEQFKGIGSKGRSWISPPGGIWVSAAYPIYSESFSTDIFSISIAFFLCEMLLKESIEVKIKWPNDIFYGSKKLIGFLPRLITRGNKTLYARVGIGMNLNNNTPKEGISLSDICNKKMLSESFWSSRILKVIYKSILFNQNRKHIIYGANKFLNTKYLPSGYSDSWSIKEIDQMGRLKIFKNESEKIISSSI
tara:strand:+ start:7107 stop:7856 length:750 start_codon:yes stop_codon:yes gene_type:complete